MILNFWQNARPTTTALWTKSFPKMANFFMSVCAKINFTMLWKRENKNKLLFVSKVGNLPLFLTNFGHSGFGGCSSPPECPCPTSMNVQPVSPSDRRFVPI